MNKVLVIDDEPIDCLILRKIMARVGVEKIYSFTDAMEALKYLSSVEDIDFPTHIFVDINMPSISGFEVLERIIQIPFALHRKIEFYILTSSINYQDIEEARKFAFVKEFISKPITFEKVRSIISCGYL
jgi:CheY-like chemotaxis protein